MGSNETAARGNLQTIDIKGKPYVTVAERIKAVTDLENLAANRYEIEKWERFEINGHYFVTCYIRVEGSVMEFGDSTKDMLVNRYSGTAEINFDGSGVDKFNPYENAETSALGRALGFAGVGIIDGVASADEVQRAVSRGGSAFGGSDKPASDAQRKYLMQLLVDRGVPSGEVVEVIKFWGDLDSSKVMTGKQASELIEKALTMTPEDGRNLYDEYVNNGENNAE